MNPFGGRMKTQKLAKLTVASLLAGILSLLTASNAFASQHIDFSVLSDGAQQLAELTVDTTNPEYFACGEGKCGEGKCGDGSDETEEEAAGDEKCGEGKCGDGDDKKCGGDDSHENDKDGEGHKCGEGKCGDE